jgi:hypothetical protein
MYETEQSGRAGCGWIAFAMRDLRYFHAGNKNAISKSMVHK